MPADTHVDNTRYSDKFLYVRNDPVNLVDPDGRFVPPPFLPIPIIPILPIQVTVTAPFFYYSMWDIQMILTALYPTPTITMIDPTQGSGDDSELKRYPDSRVSRMVDGLTGPQQTTFNDAYNKMVELLDNPFCAAVFRGDAFTALSQMSFKYVAIDPIVNLGVLVVQSEQMPTSFDPNTRTLKINKKGDFFTQALQTLPNSLAARTGLHGKNLRVFELFHELGHATNVLEDDSTSQDAQDRNNALILNGCFQKGRTINRKPGR